MKDEQPRTFTIVEHVRLGLEAIALRGVVTLLGLTYRVSLEGGAEHIDAFRREPRPVVFVFWHRRVAFLARFVHRAFQRGAGMRVSILCSFSHDGELGAKIGRGYGCHVVRGSASRGGTSGLRGLYRSIVNERCSPLVMPDGPRGPSGTVKPGAVVLAQMTGAPVLPLSWSADRCWTLRSWDKMEIPKPFARIRVRIGAPLDVPRDLEAGALEQERLRVQRALEALDA